jgi:hypothetical protein
MPATFTSTVAINATLATLLKRLRRSPAVREQRLEMADA